MQTWRFEFSVVMEGDNEADAREGALRYLEEMAGKGEIECDSELLEDDGEDNDE